MRRITPQPLEEEEGLCMDNFQWDDDVRYRFENTTPGHCKFYEMTLTENNGKWILSTLYGSMKPGGHHTSRGYGFASKWDAEEYMNKNIRKRLDHEYKEVK